MTHSTESHSSAVPTREWILVVDDEEQINGMIVNAMNSDQLEVVTAVNAEQAFHALEQHTVEPVLVLTDVLMPGMDGLTLARKLITRLKRSKVVVMSGHLSDVSWWPADLRELVFLAKPFRVSEVTALIEIARAGFKGQS